MGGEIKQQSVISITGGKYECSGYIIITPLQYTMAFTELVKSAVLYNVDDKLLYDFFFKFCSKVT